MKFLAVLLSSALLLGCSSKSGDAGGGGPPKYDPFPVPANEYSHGDPSGKEQALLELIQASRADPPSTGAKIVDLPSVQSDLQFFMVDKQKVIDDFNGYSPVPPLTFDPRLMASSKFHSEDMAMNHFQEHDGSKGEHFDQRIENAGYTDFQLIEENIFASATDVEMCNAAFLIDWGNPDLGHRMALLDLGGPMNRVRDIGISIVEIQKTQMWGPLVVTEDFGMPGQDQKRMLVGVAYKDMNGNGQYDEGEGVGGLKVVPNTGDTYAVTSMSGGYAIPFTQMTGDFDVQIQDDTGTALDQKSAAIAGDNTKLDFVVN